MSLVSPVIDKSTFLTPAATNYHIIGLTGISFERPWPKSNKGYLNCFCLPGQAVMETLAAVREIDTVKTKHSERGGGGVICSHNRSISYDCKGTAGRTDRCSQFTSHMYDSVAAATVWLQWHNWHTSAVNDKKKKKTFNFSNAAQINPIYSVNFWTFTTFKKQKLITCDTFRFIEILDTDWNRLTLLC